jgi:hypothetical protein
MALCLAALALVEPVPAPAGEAATADRDGRLALRARQALLKDPALAPLNLGVSVDHRVATLWGPVPSAALARRAAECVRGIPGLVAVVNELRVEPEDGRAPDPVFRAGEALPPAPRPRTGAATTRREAPRWLPAGAGRTAPALSPKRPPAKLTGGSARAAPTGRPGPDPRAGLTEAPRDKPVLVLPSIAVRVPARAGGSDGRPRPSAVGDAPDLEAKVERLRRASGRYEGVQVLVRDGWVYVSAGGARSEDAFDLAQRIADLPGVRRVVVTGPQLAR